MFLNKNFQRNYRNHASQQHQKTVELLFRFTGKIYLYEIFCKHRKQDLCLFLLMVGLRPDVFDIKESINQILTEVRFRCNCLSERNMMD
jgi:hypothetical protein